MQGGPKNQKWTYNFYKRGVITPGKPIYKAIHGVKYPFIAGDGAILYGSSSFSELWIVEHR